MGKLKQKSKKPKISSEKIESNAKRGGGCEQYPAFSFRYLTTNSKYNFDYFSNKTERDQATSELLERIKEISEKPYTYWNGLSKEHGSEMIPSYRININSNGLPIAQDDKLIVFRFNHQKYRLIGIRLDSCPIIYITGFDFNYSAYDHGS